MIEVELADGCAEYSVDPDALDGAPRSVGYADEELYTLQDDVWILVDEAFHEPGDGHLEWAEPVALP